MSEERPAEHSKDKPEGADGKQTPKTPAPAADPSPEDSNITPSSNPHPQSA